MANVEPWLRGTLTEVEPVRRALLHSLEMAYEDAELWCEGLDEEEMFARPAELPSVAFQLRHIVRSLDRLLSYAEGQQLSDVQIAALESEMDTGSRADVWQEFRAGLESAEARVRAIQPQSFHEIRGVGRKMLPTTVVGLLIHCAEHTQRHVGQMVTTVKVVQAGRLS
jgi:uncharacterized damage-inducible protein DinB